MKIKIDEEFVSLCKEILSYKKSANEWALIESDDMFKTEKYEGGYDATENEFCFSYYDENHQEYWFQLGMRDIEKISLGEKEEMEVLHAS